MPLHRKCIILHYRSLRHSVEILPRSAGTMVSAYALCTTGFRNRSHYRHQERRNVLGIHFVKSVSCACEEMGGSTQLAVLGLGYQVRCDRYGKTAIPFLILSLH
jgi:hypothetical protein